MVNEQGDSGVVSEAQVLPAGISETIGVYTPYVLSVHRAQVLFLAGVSSRRRNNSTIPLHPHSHSDKRATECLISFHLSVSLCLCLRLSSLSFLCLLTRHHHHHHHHPNTYQTGAGKTYTIFGDSSSPDITEGSGVVARVAEDLFSNVAVEQAKGAQVRIDLSLVQVYMEGIQDLLGDTPNKNLPLREDPHAGIFVEGLRLVPIASPADVADALEAGARNRTTALTRQNGSSSRSHAILRFYISQYHTLDDQENTGGSRVRLKRRCVGGIECVVWCNIVCVCVCVCVLGMFARVEFGVRIRLCE